MSNNLNNSSDHTRKINKSSLHSKQQLNSLPGAFRSHESSKRISDMWEYSGWKTCRLSPPTLRNEEGDEWLVCINTTQTNSKENCIAKQHLEAFGKHPALQVRTKAYSTFYKESWALCRHRINSCSGFSLEHFLWIIYRIFCELFQSMLWVRFVYIVFLFDFSVYYQRNNGWWVH